MLYPTTPSGSYVRHRGGIFVFRLAENIDYGCLRCWREKVKCDILMMYVVVVVIMVVKIVSYIG